MCADGVSSDRVMCLDGVSSDCVMSRDGLSSAVLSSSGMDRDKGFCYALWCCLKEIGEARGILSWDPSA